MKRAITKIRRYFRTNYEVLAAAVIFTIIIIAGFQFQKTIILMLEFIVVMEVVKMVSDFIKKEKLRLRFVIDIFIIFLIRDVIINASHTKKDYFTILFLLFVIFIFFIFRILSIKYSPGIIKISKDTVIEYEDDRKNKQASELKQKDNGTYEIYDGGNENKKTDSNN
jgi:uncharacterized membrane protein (DUF373 family)